MAITTESGIVSGLLPQIPFYKINSSNKAAGTSHAAGLNVGTYPTAFTAGAPGLAGATVDGTTSTLGGTFPFVNPSSGNTYLARSTLNVGSAIASVGIFDLLWYNSGISVTTTTAQTISSVTLPARDDNGSTNGAGVMCWIYASAATTNASAVTNTTISYTNSAGTASRTGTLNMVGGWPATATAGTFLPFSLQAGDSGIRSIQSLTLGTSYVTGTVLLMMIREVAYIPVIAPTSSYIMDWANLGFPQLFNGTALSFYIVPTSTTFGAISGSITYSQG